MLRRPGRILVLTGLALVLAWVGGQAAARLYTDALWFDGLGYGSVFWTRLLASGAVRATAAALGAGIVLLNLWAVARHLGPVRLRRRYGNLEIAEQVPRGAILGGAAVAAVLAGWWLSALHFGGGDALAVFAWARHVDWGAADPVFGRDLSFYVFSLPVFRRALDYLLAVLVWSSVLVVVGYVLVGAVRWRGGRLELEEAVRIHLVALAAAFVLLLAGGYLVGRYELLVEGSGFGGGLGYTDVVARIPAQRGLAVLSVMAAAALLYGAWRRTLVAPLIALGVLLVGALLAGHLYPSLVQKFRVEPNQLARESRFIAWNLEFTRRAYDLERLTIVRFPYRPGVAPAWEAVGGDLAGLPLWDSGQLRTAFNQLQSLFGYYHFPRVDFDRYGPPGGLRQVAIGVREFNPAGLDPDARTWETLHLNPKYLRGQGAVVTPAAETSALGEPVLWVANIDPVDRDPAAPAELELSQPAVYVAETASGYALLAPDRDTAFAGEPGVAFPAGTEVGSLLRRLAFAWRFGDKNLLFTGEISDGTRLVFRRTLAERIRAVAPFFVWDPDAYPVVHDGRIVWIMDGYSVTDAFPLARPVESRDGAMRTRYMRSSVKAVVDALSGGVSLYAVDEREPLLRTYARMFPGLLRPLSEMPPELRSHLRYPSLFLTVQAGILEEYHLNEPAAFFAQQDIWALPQESLDGRPAAPYRPTYLLLRLPGEARPEFVLTVPFIAQERQNMTALLAARSDPPHYGETVLYELPRDVQVPGPVQVQTMMEQDPVISSQLALWRQGGSRVALGQLRVVPLDSAFLYVQPIYLAAAGSPIPQLWRVAVSDGRQVAMAATLRAALEALEDPSAAEPPAAPGPGAAAPGAVTATGPWSRQALELLEEAERRLRAGDWAGFGSAWERLRTLLRGAAEAPPP